MKTGFNNLGNQEEPPRKRLKYCDNIKGQTTFRDTGVKKVLLLAVAAKTPENYHNIKTIIENTQINIMPYKFASDFKMQNIAAGLQTHSSKCPCGYCVKTRDFTNPNEKCQSRTIESIREMAQSWQEQSGDRKELKYYYNCEYEPLIGGDMAGNTLVLLAMPPGSLHLMIGVFNTIFQHLLDRWPDLIIWSNVYHCIRKAYQGEHFNGVQSRKLLKHLDDLENRLPIEFMPFHQCLKLLHDIDIGCFRFELNPIYKDIINEFSRTYRTLDISVTPKVHIIGIFP